MTQTLIPKGCEQWVTMSFSDQGCCTFPYTFITGRGSIRRCPRGLHECQKCSFLSPQCNPAYHLLMVRVNHLGQCSDAFIVCCSLSLRSLNLPRQQPWLKTYWRGFPGGAVVGSPPASAGDTGSSPVQEGPTCRGATGPVRHDY